MATTTNYGFTVPTSADLVKNGATAISTLGQNIDTFLFRPFTRNGIINSSFNVWQRGTSIAATGTGATYGADRWQPYRNAAGGTMSRQVTGDTTNLPFIQYCARIARDSGNTSTTTILLDSAFESVNSIPYAGKTVTFSFYARAGANYSATSNGLVATLLSGTGTDQNSLSGFTGSANVIQQTATLTTTWQRFTYSGTVGATATQLGVRFSFTPTGTAGAADYYEVTGVMLEIGNQASPYAPAGSSYQAELAMCQRYYWRTNNPSAFALHGTGLARSTTEGQFVITHPVSMRIAPTSIDFSTIAVTNAIALNSAVTGTALSQASSQTASVYTSGSSGLTADRVYFLANNNSTSGYVGFSAEL